MKPGEFNEAISRLLEAKLKPFVTEQRDLNLLTCTEIYTTIFEALVEVITQSEAPVSNEAVNYLAQQYYDGILINGTQELDPNIFTQRAKLENIETRELALLAVMLWGTDFAKPVLAQIKQRS